ncbi:MAG: FecR domain-containing protein [Bdellovibrionales bacterium]
MLKIILLSLFSPLLLNANWTVTKIKGDVSFELGTKKSNLKLGSQIVDGGVLSTGKSSKVKIELDGKTLFLGQNSKLRIEDPEKKKSSSGSIHSLIFGKIRAKVEPGKKINFKIFTRSAVAGVRGTEFFVHSDDTGDFVCTIEGKVQVNAMDGSDSILLSSGTGTRTGFGEKYTAQPTPSLLLEKWIADTSVENLMPAVMNEYPLQEARSRKLWGNNWTTKSKIFGNYIKLDDANYFTSDTNNNNTIAYTRFDAAISYNASYKSQIELRWLIANAKYEFPFAKNGTDRKNVNQLKLGETFVEKDFGSVNVKAGLQSMKWNDGHLLSRDFWSLDNYMLPAIRMRDDFGDWFVDMFYAATGSEIDYSGQVPVEMFGLKFDKLGKYNFYLLGRDFNADDAFSGNSLFGDHVIWDYGFFSERKIARFEYKLNIGQQVGTRSDGVDHNESQSEIQLGYYPILRKAFKISLGFVQASENYIPGFESPYLMGYAQIAPRSNISQTRIKITHRLSDNWNYFLEYLSSSSKGSGSFTSFNSDMKVLEEYDLGFFYKDTERGIQALLAMFYIQPTSDWPALSSKNPDGGTGLILNLQKAF